MTVNAMIEQSNITNPPQARIHFDFWPCGRGAAKGLWGSFPNGFYPRMKSLLGEGEYLYVCSGSIQEGVTVDIRSGMRPAVVADAQALPFLDGSFDVVVLDPPYTAKDAEKYGTKHFPVHRALWECARVLRPGGKLGFLHYMVPKTPPSTRRIAMVAVTCGPLMKVRAFSVFQKSAQLQLRTWKGTSQATSAATEG